MKMRTQSLVNYSDRNVKSEQGPKQMARKARTESYHCEKEDTVLCGDSISFLLI